MQDGRWNNKQFLLPFLIVVLHDPSVSAKIEFSYALKIMFIESSLRSWDIVSLPCCEFLTHFYPNFLVMETKIGSIFSETLDP